MAVKTAMEIADGFPRGGHRVRAQNLVKCARNETVSDMLGELEKIIRVDEQGGYGELPLRSVLKSWINATRETAAKEQE